MILAQERNFIHSFNFSFLSYREYLGPDTEREKIMFENDIFPRFRHFKIQFSKKIF